MWALTRKVIACSGNMRHKPSNFNPIRFVSAHCRISKCPKLNSASPLAIFTAAFFCGSAEWFYSIATRTTRNLIGEKMGGYWNSRKSYHHGACGTSFVTRPRRGPTKTTPGVSSLIAASPVKTDLGNMGAGHKLGALTNGMIKRGITKTVFFWGLEFGWHMARINDLHLRHLFPLARSIMCVPFIVTTFRRFRRIGADVHPLLWSLV